VTSSIKAGVLAVCWSGAFRCVNTMPRKKDISNISNLREAIVASHQSRKGYKVIFSRQFEVHHHTDYSQVENTQDSKFTPRSYPRATSQTPRASLSMLNARVLDSTIRKTTQQVWLDWKEENLFSLKEHGQLWPLHD